MKNILAFVAFFLYAGASLAAPPVGITPCVPSAQPADLTFSASSANVHLSTCGGTLIAFNNSANDARFRLGSASNTTALTTDLLIGSKQTVVLNVGSAGLYFAAIGAAGGTISFIQGTSAN
jgi:hypothetical protein